MFTHHIDFSEIEVEPQKAFDLLQALKGLYNGRLNVRRVIEISTPDKSVSAVIASLVASLEPAALPAPAPTKVVIDEPALLPPAAPARTKTNGHKPKRKAAPRLKMVQCLAPGCKNMFKPKSKGKGEVTKTCSKKCGQQLRHSQKAQPR